MNSCQSEYEHGMKKLAQECADHADQSRKQWTLMAWGGYGFSVLFGLLGVAICAINLPLGLFFECGSGVMLWLALDCQKNRKHFPRLFMEQRQSILDDIKKYSG